MMVLLVGAPVKDPDGNEVRNIFCETVSIADMTLISSGVGYSSAKQWWADKPEA